MDGAHSCGERRLVSSPQLVVGACELGAMLADHTHEVMRVSMGSFRTLVHFGEDVCSVLKMRLKKNQNINIITCF